MKTIASVRLIAAVAIVSLLVAALPAAAATGGLPVYEYNKEQIEALKYLNDIRKKAGLGELKLNPYLTIAAENHARYNAQNGNTGWPDAHWEEEGKPGFTGVNLGDRVKAAGGKDISGSMEVVFNFSSNANATRAVQGWLDTAYHRIPLVDPRATDFGIARVDGVVVALTGKTFEVHPKEHFYPYPYDGMTGVGIGFYGGELPDPLAPFGLTKSGYILTISSIAEMEKVRFRITDSAGNEVPFYQEYNTYLFPAFELAYDETYAVTVNYEVDGVPYQKSWSFKTQSAPAYWVSDNSRNKVKINGKYVPGISPEPKIMNGITYVPLRGLFERLNAKVAWDDHTRTAVIATTEKVIRIPAGSQTAEIDGKTVAMPQGTIIENGYTYVPLRFVSEAFGAEVGWDEATRTVSVNVPLSKPFPLMDEMFAGSKVAMENTVNPLLEIAERSGFTLDVMNIWPNYVNGDYKLLDSSGAQIGEFTIYVRDQYIDSTIYVRGVKPPLTDNNLAVFLEESLKSLTGDNRLRLADTFMETMNHPPQPADIPWRTFEIGSNKCVFEYNFYDSKLTSYDDVGWKINCNVKTDR
jgi:uncharacterized protein YkwD